MNPKPESTPAPAQPAQSEQPAPGRLPAQQDSAHPQPAARANLAPSIELRLTRPWLLALAAALLLVSLGALAGGARAIFGLRNAAQNREQLSAIHGELIRIRQILETEQDTDEEGVQAERTARITLSGQPSLGSPNAPLVLVEFTDYQCPFCSRFHIQTFPLIRKAYVVPGRVRYVTLDFPLTGVHAEALQAARASHCGEEQGRYWETHDALFRQRGQLGRGNILMAAKELGLNEQRFAACLDNTANDQRIRRDMSQGRSIGISGTPTFILGRASGRTVVGRVVVGAQPFEVFDDLIRAMLDRT